MGSDTTAAGSAAGALRTLLALCLLAGWTALLAGPVSPGAGLGSALRFAPLGFLAVFVFADRGLRLTRALFVALPAFVAGLVSAGLVIWFRDRGAGLPGPSDLLLPAVGILAGVVVGLAWRRGPLTLLLLPLKLATLAVGLGFLGLILLVAVLENAPGVPLPTAADRGAAPAAQPTGARPGWPAEGGTVRLPAAELDRLLISPRLRSDRVRWSVAVEAAGRLRVSSSARAPWFARWLNAVASARVTVRDGDLDLRQPRLRLARFETPPAALEAVTPLLTVAIRAERPVRRVLPAIRDLHGEKGALVVTLGPPQALGDR